MQTEAWRLLVWNACLRIWKVTGQPWLGLGSHIGGPRVFTRSLPGFAIARHNFGRTAYTRRGSKRLSAPLLTYD